MRKVIVSVFVFMYVYICFPIHAQMDTLKVSGTKYLCDIIQGILPDFYATNPNCIVKFVSTDNTPHALSDFILQGADIALTTQTISETDKKKISFSYKEQEFAKDAIVFYTSNKNNTKGLTLSQIHEIYTEKIHDWSGINGKNEKIMMIAYPLGHDFTLQLYKNVWNKEYYSFSALVAETNEQLQNKLNLSNYAIGYTAQSFKIKGNIVPLIVNNVAVYPNEENILSNKYPLSYSCYSIVNIQKASANKFLEWLLLPATKKKLKSYNLYTYLI